MAVLAVTSCKDKTAANTDAETKLETPAGSTPSATGIPNFHGAKDVVALVHSALPYTVCRIYHNIPFFY